MPTWFLISTSRQIHDLPPWAIYELPNVAGYGAAERARLLGNPGIIRNRLKVDAAIANDATICGLIA